MNDPDAPTDLADGVLADLLAPDAPSDPDFGAAVMAKIHREEIRRKSVLAAAVALGGVASLWGLSELVVDFSSARIEFAASLGLLALALPWAILEFD